MSKTIRFNGDAENDCNGKSKSKSRPSGRMVGIVSKHLREIDAADFEVRV